MIDTQAIRSKILDLAMRGLLTEQLPEDGSAEELYQQIQNKKLKLAKEGKIKKEKQQPLISDIEKPYELPSNWRWVRLRGLCTKIVDGDHNPPAGVQQTTDYLMLSAQNINNGKLCSLDKVRYLSAVVFEEENKRTQLEVDDVLLTIVGTIGRSCVYQGGYNICFQRSVAVISTLIDSKYLKYALDIPYIQKFMEANATGAAQLGFYLNKLEKLLIPLPPLAEQQRIVERIEQAFSFLDAIDVLQAQYADNLTVLKDKLIYAAIQGKLTEQLPEDGTAEELYQQIQAEKQALIKAGKIKKEKPLPEITEYEAPFEIPENWKWVALGNITCKITSGSTPSGGRKSDVYVAHGFPFFREQNIYNDSIHQAGMVYISEELLNTRQNSTVLAKDILLNITGGSIGRCALIPDDFDRGSINQHILIIRAVDPETRFYIHRLICSPYVQSYIKDKAVGDKDGFSGGRCKRILVPFPPLAEQQRIAQKIDEIMQVFEK